MKASGVEFVCPFCGGKVRALHSGEAGGADYHAELTHTMPACEKFDQTDMVDFLAEARQFYQRSMAGSS